ncbi:hypothetical protein [Streptomyces prasinus]
MAANRVVWFMAAFAFVAPVMAMAFREDGRLTGRAMGLGGITAMSIAVIMAIAFGRSKS